MSTQFETLYHYILDSVLIRADLIVTDPLEQQPVLVPMTQERY
jgi:hypothetical protein